MSAVKRRIIPCALALALWGCGGEQAPERRAQLATAERADDRPVIVAFGDSLTAGHGVGAERNYPWFLQRDLDARGLRYRVVNAGVEGDTTAGGVERVESVIAMRPVLAIVEFGGNDGLRGLPVRSIRDNLDEIVRRLKAAGIRVLLAGMTLPPNYGPEYIRDFEGAYRAVAAKEKVPLIPFLLEGVGAHPEYMQDDGIHPNVEGNRRVADLVMRSVVQVIE